jgi:hypothetical protein
MAQQNATEETVSDSEIVDALAKIESEFDFGYAKDARSAFTDKELVEMADTL